jgi:putative transposase
VIRWQREGFRRYWRSISVPGPGRPRISEEARKLIVRMATENHWRARKIQAELSKLGIELSLATISRYLPKALPDPGTQQRWITFLRNHCDLIAGMDFFLVPTIRFQLLYVWFAIDHGRRRILHFNVTSTGCTRVRRALPRRAQSLGGRQPAHRLFCR